MATELASIEQQPDDHEHITRGEWRRGLALMNNRLERLEKLCFQDEVDTMTGKVTRPSLATLMSRMDSHITVMCSWARMIKLIGATIVSCAAAALVVLQLWGVR